MRLGWKVMGQIGDKMEWTGSEHIICTYKILNIKLENNTILAEFCSKYL